MKRTTVAEIHVHNKERLQDISAIVNTAERLDQHVDFVIHRDAQRNVHSIAITAEPNTP